MGSGEAKGASLAALAFVLLALLPGLLPRGGAVTALRASVIPDVATADPDDLVTFTIGLDNQGPTVAGNVWANVTLASAMTHFMDGGLPPGTVTWASGPRRGYNMTNLAVANQTFTVTVRIRVGPADGTPLRLPLAVNYTDDTGVRQPEAVTVGIVTISTPSLVVTKATSANPVDPGSSFSYTISVRNTGSGTAGTVWLNDTLPTEVSYVGIRNIPPARCPTRGPTSVECRLTGLASGGGSQTYDIDVTVGGSVPRGTAFANWVFVNFTDADGTLLGQLSAFVGVDVRVIRDLSLDKVAAANVVYAGARVSFTIWYNNTAISALQAVWLNDTMPAGMRHNGSAPPATLAGSTARWQFSSVAPGPHSVTLVVEILDTVANGTLLVNNVTGDYVDSSGNMGQRVGASATVTVSDLLPRFDSYAKVAAEPRVYPGGTVRFTIYYNNTGYDTGTVTIEDTIPVGTVLANPSVTPLANGRWNRWTFLAVAPGAHALSYDLVVQDRQPGDTLVNFAYLNYTDPSGRPRSEPPRSVVLQVLEPSGPGGSSSLPLFAVLAVVLGLMAAAGYRTFGRKRTVIDEVFLLHKDGLLIKHYTRRMRPDVDSDILSGMLIAVQNFVNESFIGAEGLQREGVLDELRFGEFRIVIERGQWVIVAAVLSGDQTNRVKDAVGAAIRDLEAKLGTNLEGWSGDMRSVEGADAFMQDLIGGKYARAWGKG